MFGLFSPRCPLEISIKAWIERRFLDLSSVIGADRIRQTEIITPGHPDLPQTFHGSEQELLDLFSRICRWMDLVPEAFQLARTVNWAALLERISAPRLLQIARESFSPSHCQGIPTGCWRRWPT